MRGLPTAVVPVRGSKRWAACPPDQGCVVPLPGSGVVLGMSLLGSGLEGCAVRLASSTVQGLVVDVPRGQLPPLGEYAVPQRVRGFAYRDVASFFVMAGPSVSVVVVPIGPLIAAAPESEEVRLEVEQVVGPHPLPGPVAFICAYEQHVYVIPYFGGGGGGGNGGGGSGGSGGSGGGGGGGGGNGGGGGGGHSIHAFHIPTRTWKVHDLPEAAARAAPASLRAGPGADRPLREDAVILGGILFLEGASFDCVRRTWSSQGTVPSPDVPAGSCHPVVTPVDEAEPYCRLVRKAAGDVLVQVLQWDKLTWVNAGHCYLPGACMELAPHPGRGFVHAGAVHFWGLAAPAPAFAPLLASRGLPAVDLAADDGQSWREALLALGAVTAVPRSALWRVGLSALEVVVPAPPSLERLPELADLTVAAPGAAEPAGREPFHSAVLGTGGPALMDLFTRLLILSTPCLTSGPAKTTRGAVPTALSSADLAVVEAAADRWAGAPTSQVRPPPVAVTAYGAEGLQPGVLRAALRVLHFLGDPRAHTPPIQQAQASVPHSPAAAASGAPHTSSPAPQTPRRGPAPVLMPEDLAASIRDDDLRGDNRLLSDLSRHASARLTWSSPAHAAFLGIVSEQLLAVTPRTAVGFLAGAVASGDDHLQGRVLAYIAANFASVCNLEGVLDHPNPTPPDLVFLAGSSQDRDQPRGGGFVAFKHRLYAHSAVVDLVMPGLAGLARQMGRQARDGEHCPASRMGAATGLIAVDLSGTGISPQCLGHLIRLAYSQAVYHHRAARPRGDEGLPSDLASLFADLDACPDPALLVATHRLGMDAACVAVQSRIVLGSYDAEGLTSLFKMSGDAKLGMLRVRIRQHVGGRFRVASERIRRGAESRAAVLDRLKSFSLEALRDFFPVIAEKFKDVLAERGGGGSGGAALDFASLVLCELPGESDLTRAAVVRASGECTVTLPGCDGYAIALSGGAVAGLTGPSGGLEMAVCMGTGAILGLDSEALLELANQVLLGRLHALASLAATLPSPPQASVYKEILRRAEHQRQQERGGEGWRGEVYRPEADPVVSAVRGWAARVPVAHDVAAAALLAMAAARAGTFLALPAPDTSEALVALAESLGLVQSVVPLLSLHDPTRTSEDASMGALTSQMVPATTLARLFARVSALDPKFLRQVPSLQIYLPLLANAGSMAAHLITRAQRDGTAPHRDDLSLDPDLCGFV